MPITAIRAALVELLRALAPVTDPAALAESEAARRALVQAHAQAAVAPALAEWAAFLGREQERVARGGDVMLFQAAIAAGDAHPVALAAEAAWAAGEFAKPFLRLLNRGSGRAERAPCESYAGGSSALLLLPDGGFVAAHGHRLSLWRRGAGVAERTIATGHRGAIYDLALHPDGRRLFTGCLTDADEDDDDGRVLAFDLTTGKRLATYAGAGARRASFDLSADGSKLVVAGGPLRLWTVDGLAGAPSAPTWTIDGAYEVAAFHPDGTKLVALRNSGTIELRAVADGALLRDFAAFPEAVNAHVRPRLFGDGRRSLWVVEGVSAMALIDLEAGKLEDWIAGHTGDLESLALSRDEQRVLTTSQDGTFRIWDYRSGDCLHAQRVEGLTGGGALFVDDEARVLALGYRGHAASVWDLAPATPELTSAGRYTRFRLSHDRRRLLALDADGRALQLDCITGATLGPLPVAVALKAVSGSVSADGQRWIVYTRGTMAAFDLATGALVESRSREPGQIVHLDREGHEIVLDRPADAACLARVVGQTLLRLDDTTMTVLRLSAAGDLEARPAKAATPPPWQAALIDGERVLRIDRDGRLDLWHSASAGPTSAVRFWSGPHFHSAGRSKLALAVDRAAARAWFSWPDGVVRTADYAAEPPLVRELVRAPTPIHDLDHGPDGLLLGCVDRCLLLDPTTGAPRHWLTYEPAPRPVRAQLAADHTIVVLREGELQLWRLVTPSR